MLNHQQKYAQLQVRQVGKRTDNSPTSLSLSIETSRTKMKFLCITDCLSKHETHVIFKSKLVTQSEN